MPGEDLQRLAIDAQQKGEHARAAGLFVRAIDAEPADWIAHTCLGISLRVLGRIDDAIAVQRRAADLSGDHRALSNLALTYRDAGRLDDAIATLRNAIAGAPDAADLHGNLAGMLLKADRPVEAEVSARRALALAPGRARFETNLGYARKEQGDLAGAARHLRRAIALDPGDADAHWNLGLTLLAGGASPADEAEGWRELEWRRQIPGLRLSVRPEVAAVPEWTGEPLDGRTLLLQAEQGLGDTLQLCRYARRAKLAGGAGRVMLECQPPLVRLLRGCDGVDDVIARGDRLPAAADVRAALFSLPVWLGGPVFANGDDDAPYLHADPERRARWAGILAARAAGTALKIGIAWQGSRQYRADARRSILVTEFIPLLRVAAGAGARIFSLQRGEGSEQLAALPSDAPVDDLAAELDAGVAAGGAFLDTAAVMTHLDLVITSDTAIPHLAGALGVPVWTALAALPDWRWRMAGGASPWYPTMRLFRQTTAGDWAGVFARLSAALTAWSPQ